MSKPIKVVDQLPKLDTVTLEKLKVPIDRCWQAIGNDVLQCAEECGEEVDNEQAVESVIDADRLRMYGGEYSSLQQGSAVGNAANDLVKSLIAAHGYSKVLRWLSRNISLN